MKYDLCIIGGFGHVGLPLSILFASKGIKVCAYDISKDTEKVLSEGKMPFIEFGAEKYFPQVLKDGNLHLSTSPDCISESRNVLITIGTPTDLHMSPEPVVEQLIEDYMKYFRDGQLIILRSTVYPGTTERLSRIFEKKSVKADVAFCPERIAQGYAIKELLELPHIISSTSEEGISRAKELFRVLNDDIIVLKPIEAELAKLFTNAWRYISFSTANQFFVIANDAGADFYKIYDAMAYKYPRIMGLPTPGFASGPCLFKDTVHLNAFSQHNFHVGNAAILINEGMPTYVVDRLKLKHDLRNKRVGILGMAFKANIDDKRDSLSYKLFKLLEFEAKEVYCSDPYIKGEGFVSPEELLRKSDIIIVGTPHREYANLKIDSSKDLVDVWNLYGKGCVL